MSRFALLEHGVRDTLSGATLRPTDVEWPVYQTWLAEGNLPDPYIPAPPEPLSAEELAARAEAAATKALREDLRANALIQQLRQRTPEDVDAWITANVVDLASARAVLRILAYVVAYLARERLG